MRLCGRDADPLIMSSVRWPRVGRVLFVSDDWWEELIPGGTQSTCARSDQEAYIADLRERPSPPPPAA